MKVLFLNLFPSLLPFFFTVDSSGSSDRKEKGCDLEDMVPTPKRCRLANHSAITEFFQSGQYPEFWGVRCPAQDLNPKDNSALDYLLLLWPASFCNLIADEMDRYTCERGTSTWCKTSMTGLRLPYIYRYCFYNGYQDYPAPGFTGMKIFWLVCLLCLSTGLGLNFGHCCTICMSLEASISLKKAYQYSRRCSPECKSV